MLRVMYIAIWLYTALLLGGGVMGYLKKGSLMSLVMGVVFSLLISLWTVLHAKGRKWAGSWLLLTVLVLDSFFSWRYIKTEALMPAGIFTILSSILLIIIYLQIKNR
jgi:uncharacterized membrane protein (UPF0136 family)